MKAAGDRSEGAEAELKRIEQKRKTPVRELRKGKGGVVAMKKTRENVNGLLGWGAMLGKQTERRRRKREGRGVCVRGLLRIRSSDCGGDESGTASQK